MSQPVKTNNVRLHFYVSKQLSERVESVGTMLGQAKARAAAFLLDHASRAEEQVLAEIDRRLEASRKPAATRDAPGSGSGDADGEIVLMYVRLEAEVASRIEQLAKTRGLSLSRVCAWLLSRAAEDERWT